MKIHSQSEQFDTLRSFASSRPKPEYYDGGDEYNDAAGLAEDDSDRAEKSGDPEDHLTAWHGHDEAKKLSPGWDASSYHSDMMEYHKSHQ